MNEIKWYKEGNVCHFTFIIGNEESKFQITDDATTDAILQKAFALRRQWNTAVEKLKAFAEDLGK
jgi:hypothetical protein